jgi:hypothetical protein
MHLLILCYVNVQCTVSLVRVSCTHMRGSRFSITECCSEGT